MGVQEPSEHVVQSVATRTDTDPLELPPLYRAIDPDALNELVTESTDALDEVEFSYAGHSVTVKDDGTVDITDNRTDVNQAKTVSND